MTEMNSVRPIRNQNQGQAFSGSVGFDVILSDGKECRVF